MELLQLGLKVRVKDQDGIIKFIGETQFAPGVWVGVELFEPTGKNNGSINGVKYFECEKPGNYGIFAKPTIIEIIDSESPKKSSKEENIINRLQSKLQDTLADLKLYKDKVAQYQDLENNLEQLSVEKFHLSDVNKRLKSELKEAQLKYEASVEELSVLREELKLNQELEDEISQTHQNLNDLNLLLQRNKSLEIALATLKGSSNQKISDLTKELGVFKENNAEQLSQKLAKAEETIIELKTQLESVSDLNEIVEHLTAENDQLNTKVNQLVQQIDEFNILQSRENDLKETHSQIENSLQSTINNLQISLNEQVKKKEQLEASKNELINEVRILKQTSQANVGSDNATNTGKILENTKLQLKLKLRECEYIRLLLNIAQRKLDGIPSNYAHSLSTLLEIRNFVNGLTAPTFSQELKLVYVKAQLDYAYSASKNCIASDAALASRLENFNNLLLSHIQDDTLAELQLGVTNTLITTIMNANASNYVKNNIMLLFILFECQIIDGFFNCMFSLQSNEEVSKLRVQAGEIRKKVKSLSFEAEVDDTYNIDIGDVTLLVLNDYFGIYDIDFDSKITDPNFFSILSSIGDRFSRYSEELDRTFQTKAEEKQVEETSEYSIKESLAEKEEMVKDLEITVKLLENNMSSMDQKHKTTVGKLRLELNEVQAKLATVQEQYTAILERNKSLEVEVAKLLSSGKYFNLAFLAGKFNDLSSERHYVSDLGLIEEINYLRSLVIHESNDDFSWLEPRPKIKLPQPATPNIRTISSHLQKIAKSAALVRNTPDSTHKLKANNPKYINELIKEHMAKYQKDRDKVFVI